MEDVDRVDTADFIDCPERLCRAAPVETFDRSEPSREQPLVHQASVMTHFEVVP
jgi:hypothetical protein